MKEICKECSCMTCECNNKLQATELLNSCYGCDGEQDCKKIINEQNCLYQARKKIREVK